MRSLILALSLLTSFSTFAAHSHLEHLFIPSGFDSNDNVELVVTGKFPNPCFTRTAVKTEIIGNLIKADVSYQVQHHNNCDQLSIPFSETIALGALEAGTYDVVINGGTTTELKGILEVGSSTTDSIDEHIYAKVDYVNLGFSGGSSGDALLIASSPSPCLVLDHVEYVSNGKDTYSILPVMKRISSECAEETTQFEIPVTFDLSAFESNKVLLFVRSIDGKSVQAFVTK